MGYIPSNSSEWASAAALIRDAHAEGRPLGPLGDAALVEVATAYANITDEGEPLARKVLSDFEVSLMASAALREAVKDSTDELGRAHGREVMRATQEEWLAIAEAWPHPEDQEGLWRALFAALARRLDGLDAELPARREAAVLAALARSKQTHLDATATFERFKDFSERLHVWLEPLQAMYPGAVEALLQSGDDALKDALLIDFSTPEGQARHRELSLAAASRGRLT